MSCKTSSANAVIDVFLVQEHWLTPENLYKLEKFFPEYFF